MRPPTPQETLTIFWPMTIPAHARFCITSPFPLRVSYPHNITFTLTLTAPMHLSSPSPVHVIPSGILSPGFERGWSRLPMELKLRILRYVVVWPSAIWPTNANRVMCGSLFKCMRMTPEIAGLTRGLFFAENTFVLLPLQEEVGVFRGFPLMGVRSLVRRIKLLTWLEPGDWQTMDAIAQRGLGFESLTHVEVRCSVVRFVRLFFAEHGATKDDTAGLWAVQLRHRLPPEVEFGPNGLVVFDHSELERGNADAKLVERVEQVEGLVREKFKFGVRQKSCRRRCTTVE